MIPRSRLLTRFAILSVLLLGLGYVWTMPASQVASAAPCCQSCPGFTEPGEEVVYCSNQCGGATSGSCYDTCMDGVWRCYRTCYYCGGGGGGGTYCYTNSDCPYMPGYGFGNCVGGNCVY